jgi:spermidine synthase
MKTRLYIPVYAFTLLLSAALLFSVQPMFSKMILPLLGGTPQVWNTAMLFFQVTLLAGYAYAHGTTRFLTIRAQAVLHLVLLAIFTIVLPLAIPDNSLPPKDSDPTWWQLSVMAASIGGPFFVLAASAPMLQRWFASTDHPDAHNPYFLYGASNLGSMSSLLLYPVLAEPLLTLAGQSNVWMFGYFGLIVMVAVAAFCMWPHGHSAIWAKREAHSDDAKPVTWSMRLSWLVLAFIPSSLMLGVTTYVTTDVASAPLLWIVPLAIYVGTFILVFAKRTYVSNNNLSIIQGLLIACLALLLLMQHTEHKFMLIGFHLLLFFITAWMCHGILAAKRPHNRHLTEFYLLMSAGGALGGFFNAIIAPQVFTSALEYPLVLAAACFCRLWGKADKDSKGSGGLFDLAMVAAGIGAVILSKHMSFSSDFITLSCGLVVFGALIMNIDKRWSFALVAAMALIINPPSNRITDQIVLHSERNFFGIINVIDDDFTGMRTILHGTTAHGTQSLKDEYKTLNISYYSEHSPLADVFGVLDTQSGEQHVGILGLGSGATACHSKKVRSFDFFEIDPAVIAIAENTDYFTYLSDCGSPYSIVLGDARMTIQDKPDAYYDMILLDVFSSDNIPVHVLTEEAVRTYLSKLKPNGTIVFHVSNNYLDLEPVLARTAEKIGIPAVGRFADGGLLEGSEIPYFSAHYVAMSYSKDVIKDLQTRRWTEAMTHKGVESWSDQYSNILSVFGSTISIKRASIEQAFEEEDKEARATSSPEK